MVWQGRTGVQKTKKGLDQSGFLYIIPTFFFPPIHSYPLHPLLSQVSPAIHAYCLTHTSTRDLQYRSKCSTNNQYTENSIASDKGWITHHFHQQFIQFVDLILPQAIIGFHYRTGQPPQPHCQKYFCRNVIQTEKEAKKAFSRSPHISHGFRDFKAKGTVRPSCLTFLSIMGVKIHYPANMKFLKVISIKLTLMFTFISALLI